MKQGELSVGQCGVFLWLFFVLCWFLSYSSGFLKHLILSFSSRISFFGQKGQGHEYDSFDSATYVARCKLRCFSSVYWEGRRR